MDEEIQKVNMFIPIQKVNAERHEVWGWGAVEEPDASDEILDYNSSKPHFLDWSKRAEKRSGGKSLGNVRAMHQNIAAGKIIELRPDDMSKGFYVGAKIIDDAEWKKVETGVYTGFSVGGSYLKRWSDYEHPGKIRYTAKPSELSIVDAPCIPSATFQMVKADGTQTLRKFQSGTGTRMIPIFWDDEELDKWEEADHPRAADGKFGSGGGGGGKKEAPAKPEYNDTDSDLQAAVNEANFNEPNPHGGGDFELWEPEPGDPDYKAPKPTPIEPNPEDNELDENDKAMLAAKERGQRREKNQREQEDRERKARNRTPEQQMRQDQRDRRANTIIKAEEDWDEEDDMNKVLELEQTIDQAKLELAKLKQAIELRKQEIPGAPEPVADLDLPSKVGAGFEVQQMPAQSVPLEIKPNAEPSQEVLAQHAVVSKDLTPAFEAWLPKVGALVKSMVAEAIAEAFRDLQKSTNPTAEQSAPVRINVVTRKPIKVLRKE